MTDATLLRPLLALALACTLVGDIHAQASDFDRVVAPAGQSVNTLGDYLVQQAWVNEPRKRDLEAQIAVADARIDLQRRGWLDQINANVNFSSLRDTLNVFGVSRFGRNDNQYLAPGVNYGVAVNIGGLVNNKRRTAVARAERDVAAAKLDLPKPELRLAVLAALQEATNTRELLRIRRRAEVDAETNYQLVRSLYDQGKAQFQDLAQASEVYFRAVESTSVAKNNQLAAQLELESLTGLSAAEIDEARRRYGASAD